MVVVMMMVAVAVAVVLVVAVRAVGMVVGVVMKVCTYVRKFA